MSKRKDSRYASGRSPHWIKSKNPNAPAVKREAEEMEELQGQQAASQEVRDEFKVLVEECRSALKKSR